MNGTHTTAHVKSTGCISNLLDGTGLENILVKAGYNLVGDINMADLVIINTCAFNQAKENEAIDAIMQAKSRMRANARLVVCGCLPEINSDRLKEIHGDVSFGPRKSEDLLAFLSLSSHLQEQDNLGNQMEWSVDAPISYSQYSPLKKAIFRSKQVLEYIPMIKNTKLIKRLLGPLFIYADDVFCLKIESGCWGVCTYCAIRFAKGRAVSRPLSEIASELERATAGGFSKFVLVGDEITAYGHDLPLSPDILDVMDLFLTNNKVATLYLESFEPGFMISNLDRLLKAMSFGKINVLGSSVQSGSNRILELMKRQYSADDFIDSIEIIRKQYPSVLLRSEIIVGFPGETYGDFMKSLELAKRLNFDFLDVYEYEDRPNTAASRMPDKIASEIKKERRREIFQEHYRRLVFRGRKKRPISATSK
jgi:threonylcarbamoyladenosine tRNA methylthiotransferase MtaB